LGFRDLVFSAYSVYVGSGFLSIICCSESYPVLRYGSSGASVSNPEGISIDAGSGDLSTCYSDNALLNQHLQNHYLQYLHSKISTRRF